MQILKGNIDTATIRYVPHGINQEIFKKVTVPEEFRKQLFNNKNYKFVLFWMNRNIKRKQPSDVIWAYKLFVDTLPESDRLSTVLVMHTAPVDENGTDLIAVKEAICPDYNVVFSESRISQSELNYLYNIADVTINIAGNEGFGLTTAESLMAETPIIVLATGGLQDQCGFTLNGKPLTADDYINIGSVHVRKQWADKLEHGDWVYPVWAAAHTMVGSVPTPYIIDDKVDVDEVAVAIKYWYDKTPEERRASGRVGRDWMLGDVSNLSSDKMCFMMGNAIEDAITNFKPRERYKIYKIK